MLVVGLFDQVGVIKKVPGRKSDVSDAEWIARRPERNALDAPISGGYLAASEGTLSMMIGGRQAVLDRAARVLQAIASRITRAGNVGAGQAAKLAHQLVFSLNVMALLEGLKLGAAAGVEPEVLKGILKDGIANSGVLELWKDLGPRWKGMLEATPPHVTPPNLRKDLHLVLEMAQALGVRLLDARGAGAGLPDEGRSFLAEVPSVPRRACWSPLQWRTPQSLDANLSTWLAQPVLNSS